MNKREMKEQWIVEAIESAKGLAAEMYEQIIDEADDLCIDREWFLGKVVCYIRAESEGQK